MRREDNDAKYYVPESPNRDNTIEQHSHTRRNFDFVGMELLLKGADAEFAA